jgi:hypothetical protein
MNHENRKSEAVPKTEVVEQPRLIVFILGFSLIKVLGPRQKSEDRHLGGHPYG